MVGSDPVDAQARARRVIGTRGSNIWLQIVYAVATSGHDFEDHVLLGCVAGALPTHTAIAHKCLPRTHGYPYAGLVQDTSDGVCAVRYGSLHGRCAHLHPKPLTLNPGVHTPLSRAFETPTSRHVFCLLNSGATHASCRFSPPTHKLSKHTTPFERVICMRRHAAWPASRFAANMFQLSSSVFAVEAAFGRVLGSWVNELRPHRKVELDGDRPQPNTCPTSAVVIRSRWRYQPWPVDSAHPPPGMHVCR